MSVISDVRIYRAVSPLSRPIADSTHSLSEISFYVVEVETERSVTGQGYLLSFHYSPGAISGALKDIRQLATGLHANETGLLSTKAAAEHEYFGQEGIQKWALAAVNVAMWDCWGKTLEVPVWKLLGTCASRVPVYGSGGWLSYSIDELLGEVLEYKMRGFQAVKVKVGGGLERDLERLRKVREALGPEVKIMMDANQGMTLQDALALSRKAEALDIFWFEEPLHHRDYEGYAILRSRSAISLAMGEREYDIEALKALVERRALDLWQPDLIRIGGVEEWLRSAAFAGAHHIPVLPHYYKDYDVPLLCTIPNGVGAESFDWIDGIIDNTMRIENGYAFPRSGPGWGFSFRKEFLVSAQ
jgi:L-alanine-DL-glutamate epimerase-like enolase superfamily enzyme